MLSYPNHDIFVTVNVKSSEFVKQDTKAGKERKKKFQLSWLFNGTFNVSLIITILMLIFKLSLIITSVMLNYY